MRVDYSTKSRSQCQTGSYERLGQTEDIGDVIRKLFDHKGIAGGDVASAAKRFDDSQNQTCPKEERWASDELGQTEQDIGESIGWVKNFEEIQTD